MTLNLMAITMIAISITVYDIFAVEICTTLTLTFRMSQLRADVCLPVLTILMFALSVTVYELFTFELIKMTF